MGRFFGPKEVFVSFGSEGECHLAGFLSSGAIKGYFIDIIISTI